MIDKLTLINNVLQVAYEKGSPRGDISCVMVARLENNHIYAKYFYGNEADFVYEILTEKSLSEAIYDLQNKGE